jgi:predicted O-linked N-acetylglucosamine transferase (SPINDLY family)
MGVPVVARPGETTASRGSASILHAVGLAELATESTQEYIATAAKLARDPAQLGELRRTLRVRVQGSVVGDYRGFAGRYAAAVHGMWQRAAARR